MIPSQPTDGGRIVNRRRPPRIPVSGLSFVIRSSYGQMAVARKGVGRSTTDPIRNRVRELFGSKVADALVGSRTGRQRLETKAGVIRFYAKRTWVDGLSAEEEKLITRAGQTMLGRSHELFPGSALERTLVERRIVAGLKTTPSVKAGSWRAKTPKL